MYSSFLATILSTIDTMGTLTVKKDIWNDSMRNKIQGDVDIIQTCKSRLHNCIELDLTTVRRKKRASEVESSRSFWSRQIH
jgi:hypothetical protein